MEQLCKKRVANYRKAWEAIVPWVKGVNDDPHKAFCSVCCRTFSISHGGYSDLTRHEKRHIHRELSKEANVAGTGTSVVTSTSEIAEADSRTREETTEGRKVSGLPTGKWGDLSSSLRMWFPPLRLLSASIWQVVQQRQVQSYNRVEEFVSVVLELVPDLLSTEEKIELLIGLRTKFALDSCHHTTFITVKMMLPHLDRVSRIAEIASSDGDMGQTVDAAVKEFKELIQGLLKSPAYRRSFFQEIYPLRYGPSYDAALQLLVCEFLSRLEELLTVPSFHEAASLFDDDPLLFEEFLQMGDDLQPIQELLLHRKHFTCLLSGSSSPTKSNTVVSTLSDSPIVPAALTASEQSCESQMSQNRPDMFGVSIDEGSGADVKEDDPGMQRDSDEGSNNPPSSPYIVVNWRGDDDDDDDDGDEGDSQRDSDEEASGTSQHDQQGDTGQSSQTSNGLSSSPYIVVNWSGDDDDDDDDDDVDDVDVDEGGDSQRDSDKASGTSQHDQQGDMQRTLNEEKKKEINDCKIDCERMVNDRSEESEPPSTEGPRPSTQQATLQKMPSHSKKQDAKRPRKYPCLECDKVCTSSYHLRRHQKLHTGLTPHACPHCDKTFQQKAGLTTHLNIHTGNRPFECPSCRKKFFRVSALVDHLVRHTDCMMDCERMINEQSEVKDLPSTEQSRLSTLQATLRKAHKAPKYPCSTCGKVFLRPSGLAEHQKMKDLQRRPTPHYARNKNCRIDCERMVNDRSEEREPPSTEGSQSSTQQATLQKMPSHSKKQDTKRPRKYPCLECDKVFTSSYHLRSHQKLHTGLTPHACPHCDKTFQQKAGLTTHLNIHTGNQPFECSSCRKKFFRVSALVDHLVRHTDCMMDCERMINEQSEVKDLPSTEQSRLSTLQATLRKAHKAPKYPCSTCGKVFLRPSGLAEHQKMNDLQRGTPHYARNKNCRIDCERMVNDRSEEREPPSTEGSQSSTQQATLQKMPSHSKKQDTKRPWKYPCLECDKVFTSSYHLRSHQKLHTGMRPHACPHCDKTFQQKAGLTIHLNIHRGNRPFECSSCRKKFFRVSALVDHLTA
ncbi:zinc finger protein 420-like isoform X2 [Engraulis encrasicolus]|uniref:zinc finger protein 420-like isoform X2 n=1 Tax=Engraulis encrasicolus TaxID=184585 RepID=UPI002FD5D3FA